MGRRVLGRAGLDMGEFNFARPYWKRHNVLRLVYGMHKKKNE